MSEKGKKLVALFVPIFLVLVVDQVTKYQIRTSPGLQRTELIDGWLAFNFTKNPGMALGMDWLSTPAISVVAILATFGILAYVLFHLKRSNLAYLVCMGLILGGALGNITDRIFMGIISGDGGVLEGHVVDFIHFTLTIGDTPVFPYIFNVADIAISTSIIVLILFHRRLMPVEEDQTEDSMEEKESENQEISSLHNISTEEQAIPSSSSASSEEKQTGDAGM